MKKVLINRDFKDRATKKMRTAGSIVEMSEERVEEILAVDKKLITVVGTVVENTTEENAKEK